MGAAEYTPSSVPKTLWYVIVAKLTSFKVGACNPLSCYCMLLGCNVSVEDNVRADVKETECEGVHVIRLSQNTDTWLGTVGTSVNLGGFTKCGQFIWLRTKYCA